MSKRYFIPLLVVALATRSLAWSGDGQEPKHLSVARDMVKSLDLSKTSYEHGVGSVKFTAPVECHTDCSGLLNHLLKHCYGYNDDHLQTWLGAKRPTASRYYDAIVAKKGFTHVSRISDAVAGDILAVKYFVRKDNTGHAMLVSGVALKMKAKNPIVEGTDQWEVKVIDASRSGHGSTDTRYKKGADGKDHDGLGEGIFRIYTDKKGEVAGFSWSTFTTSKYVAPDDEKLVIGRLIAGFKPKK